MMKRLLHTLVIMVSMVLAANAQQPIDNIPRLKIDESIAKTKLTVNPQVSSVEELKFYIEDESGLLKTRGSGDYYLLERNGKSASELYTNVLSAISTMYKNPEKVLSKVDNVSITVSGTALDVPVSKDASLTNSVFPQKNDYYGFDYTLSFQFKDGKIRVNAPSFDVDNILYSDVLDGGRYDGVAPTFRKHFGITDDKINIGFEKYLNELVVAILKKSVTINNW